MISREDVAKILEIEDRSLRYFLYVKKPDNMYSTFEVAKKSGGSRQINAPHKELRNIQRKLAYILNLVYSIKPPVYGFVKNRNIKDNATKHVKKRAVFNLDLKDFFNQIHFGRIRGMLINKPYGIGEEAATAIAQIACYNGILPQGAPSSPIITNMICSPLDTQLTRLAKKHKLSYTRYADDITFSTYMHNFPQEIVFGESNDLKIGEELSSIIKRNSFSVNEKKVFLNTQRTRQEVTGLVVNKFPNLKREYIKLVRSILYKCKSEGIYSAAIMYINEGYCKNEGIISKVGSLEHKETIENWFKSVLKGKIEYIREIRGAEDLIFIKYASQMNVVFKEKVFNLKRQIDFYESIADNVVIIENEEHQRQGSGFILEQLGLMTANHLTKDELFYSVFTHKMDSLGKISKLFNEKSSDFEIDYSLYNLNVDTSNGLELGDSTNVAIGDEVMLVAYPNYNKGDTFNITRCNVTSKSTYFGKPLYTVDSIILHGSSGGVVLDSDNKVIGIIKAGIASIDEELSAGKHGFVPIHLVIRHIKENK